MELTPILVNARRLILVHIAAKTLMNVLFGQVFAKMALHASTLLGVTLVFVLMDGQVLIAVKILMTVLVLLVLMELHAMIELVHSTVNVHLGKLVGYFMHVLTNIKQ